MRRLGAVLRPLRGVAGLVSATRRTVAAVPDVVDAILVLPTLSRQLDEVRIATATLPDILVELERVHRDTCALPAIETEIGRMNRTVEQVERNTLAVEQLAEVALPLTGAAVRVGRIADRLPQRRPPRA